ncbi:hypothetical protein GGR56DRAFT_635025 [Xylariaceae sp. FL0804]|nr:hypothetical protein GGR56DRAFT_635025 [Xylariaceae sp. FL0804]
MLIPNRVLLVLGRYGAVLLAALLVYYVIRDPVSAALDSFSASPSPADNLGFQVSGLDGDGKGSAITGAETGENDGDDGAGSKDEEEDDVVATNPARGPAAAAGDIREKNTQRPIGEEPIRYVKKYKPVPERYPPMTDHFPYLSKASKAPPVLENNLPPSPHVEEPTPLLIGFTTNWPLLLQCVCSYVAAGWPPADIYVVENTGTFLANREETLGLQNPFFLNLTALHMLGVNVVSTPTLLTTAQLQNYYLSLAIQRGWPYYFWSKQHVLVFSDEEVKKKDRDHDWDHDPYATIYERCVGLLRYLEGPNMPPWGTHFFASDHLTLVNSEVHLDVGAWDTHIPYDAADCDMYLRLHWAGYWQPQSEAGLVYDVGDLLLDDIGALFRLPGAHAGFRGDPVFAPGGDESAELQREREVSAWVEQRGETYPHLIEVAGRMQDVVEAERSRDKENSNSNDNNKNNNNNYNSGNKNKNTKNAKNTKDDDDDMPLRGSGSGASGRAGAAGGGGGSSKRRKGGGAGRQRGGQGEPFYRSADGFARGIEALTDAGRRVFADKWGHRGCDLLDLGIEGRDEWRLAPDWTGDGAGGDGWDRRDWGLGEA